MRVRTRFLLVLLVGAVLLPALPALPACGSEADAGPRTHLLLERLPAPASSAGFESRCYVLRDGAPYGRLTLSAYPEVQGEQAFWRVREGIDPLRPGGERVVAQALLTPSLHAVEGRYNRRNSEGFIEATWQRSGSRGFEVQHTTQDYENRLEIAAAPATTTLAGALLFLRSVPVERAVYELPDFDPNPDVGASYVAPMRLEVHGLAPWRVGGGERSGLIVSLTRGQQTLRMALDPKSRAFLGARFIGLPFQFVPEGSGPVGLVDAEASGLQTPIERAHARSAAVRAELPAPQAGFLWTGDLRLGDTRVGSVRLEAAPSAFGGDAGWAVLETVTSRTGEAVVITEQSAFLGRRLEILRGARSDTRPAGSASSTYVRTAGGMETVRRVGEGREGPTLLSAAPGATAGLPAVLLFLRAVPEETALYVLPGFNPRFAGPPKAGTGSLAFNGADIRVEVRGRSTLEVDDRQIPSLMAACRHRSGLSYDVHVDPRTRRFLGLIGHLPRLSYLPKRSQAKSVTWYDAVESAPQTARQAFVKFGRGYHRPRPELLADAIHWPSLTAQAIAGGRYPEGTPEATIRRDWIEVFVGMSKHRTQGDCDDLLFQIFMTATESQHADGSITIQTLPVYGGHAYRCREIGGRWYIVAID